jgi:hypothetical protein
VKKFDKSRKIFLNGCKRLIMKNVKTLKIDTLRMSNSPILGGQNYNKRGILCKLYHRLKYEEMEDIKVLKEISYRGNTYSIQYEYKTERCIDGWTYHTLTLISKNGVGIKNIENSWKDKKDSSVIVKCQELINKRIELNKTPFNYNGEFNQWNGNLDTWDE